MVKTLSKQQDDFLKTASSLMEKHVDIREFCRVAFSEALGSNSAEATLYFLGDDAFSDPKILLIKLEQLFSSGATVLLSRLVDKANSGALGQAAR
jgi:hypothetical protein